MIMIWGLVSGSLTFGRDARALLDLKSLLPPGHYLILFQNNAELRPAGGFIGSFATVDITKFGYKNFQIDTNIYKRDRVFESFTDIKPPKPLQTISPKWAMRDSNWFPDFRDSARQVSWFYQQEAGDPVDGVIAVNATVVQDLLAIIGPIEIEHEEYLTSDNFFDLLHYKVEKEYFDNPDNQIIDEPKSILKKLYPAIAQRIITDPKIAIKVSQLLLQELDEKHIQLFHFDPAVEDKILRLNWGGAISKSQGDYLHINNANIGGAKSSQNILQNTVLEVTKRANMLEHNLIIDRIHTGTGLWPDGENKNYIRILLPINAKIQTVSINNTPVANTEIAEELLGDRLSFGLWFSTRPKQKNTLRIKYSTQDFFEPYTFVYQKQSGVVSERLKIIYNNEVIFSDNVVQDITIKASH